MEREGGGGHCKVERILSGRWKVKMNQELGTDGTFWIKFMQETKVDWKEKDS